MSGDGYGSALAHPAPSQLRTVPRKEAEFETKVRTEVRPNVESLMLLIR